MKFGLLSLAFALHFAVSAPAVAQVTRENGIADQFVERVPEDQALVSIGQAKLPEIDPRSIKVLIWNIKKAELPLWQSEFMTYGQNRDLILLQEAYRSKLFERTLNFFKRIRWDMGVAFLNKRDNLIPAGTMIGSKVEPIETIVRHSPDLEPVLKTPKSMTFAKYRIHGHNKDLLVISVHAINFTAPWTFKRHIRVAEREIARHDGPVLYAGDFNTWSEGRLRQLEESTKSVGLKAVVFNDGDKRMTFSDNPLDHAFIRGLKVKSADVIEESQGSDHKPLTLELELAI